MVEVFQKVIISFIQKGHYLQLFIINTHYVLHACYRMSTVINTNMFTNGMLALKEQLVP